MAKGPGKTSRRGITLAQIFRMFPDDNAAEKYFIKTRWPNRPHCPYCGSTSVLSGAKHKTMPYRCRQRECRKRFSVRTKTVMEASNLGYQVWAVAIHLLMTSLKSVSGMKLHRDLGVTQKSAWFLAHRLREAWHRIKDPFLGPVEADETYMGGIRKNMSKSRRRQLTGRGAVGKTVVVGVKDRKTNRISAAVVEGTDACTLQAFIEDRVSHTAKVFTDEHGGYVGLLVDSHESVNHSADEYVRDEAHTNGVESFWSMLKCAHKGTFHKISPQHMDRYITEFAGRHNMRSLDTEEQMRQLMAGMKGRRLRYPDLIAPNGLESGARPF